MSAAPIPDRALSPLVIVSPHFDDGVFACGDLMAEHPGSTVITVFGDGPAVWDDPTAWDLTAGFNPGQNAVAARRLEDQEALAELDSAPVWLPFWERQYGRATTMQEIQPALEAAILMASPVAVAIPLGMFDVDHVVTHAAAVPLVTRYPNLVWLAYEEALYRMLPDGELLERLTGLVRAGIKPVRAGRTRLRPSSRKRRAVECYRSRLQLLDREGRAAYAEALSPERFWRLLPPDATAT